MFKNSGWIYLVLLLSVLLTACGGNPTGNSNQHSTSQQQKLVLNVSGSGSSLSTSEYWSLSTFFTAQFFVKVTPLTNGNASIDSITVQGSTPGKPCSYMGQFAYKVTSQGKVLVSKNPTDQTVTAITLNPQVQGYNLTFYKATPGNGIIVHQGDSTVSFGAVFDATVWEADLSDPENPQLICKEADTDLVRLGGPYKNSSEFVITIPHMAPPPTVGPGGLWASPSPNNGATITGPIQLAANAITGSSSIQRVKFTAWWPALGSVSSWPVLCDQTVPTDATNKLYSCNWNLPGVPAGRVNVSFDVYDTSGKVNYAPNGVHTLLYNPTSSLSPTPVPTTAPVDFTPFVGTWSAHSRGLIMKVDGNALYGGRTFVTCDNVYGPPCDNPPQGGMNTTIQFTSIVGQTAYGTITSGTGDRIFKTSQLMPIGTHIQITLDKPDDVIFVSDGWILCGPNFSQKYQVDCTSGA